MLEEESGGWSEEEASVTATRSTATGYATEWRGQAGRMHKKSKGGVEMGLREKLSVNMAEGCACVIVWA